jgi:hypothetical protein
MKYIYLTLFYYNNLNTWFITGFTDEDPAGSPLKGRRGPAPVASRRVASRRVASGGPKGQGERQCGNDSTQK